MAKGKKPYKAPQSRTLAQKIQAKNNVRTAIETMMDKQLKARLRLGWAFNISIADVLGATPEQISEVSTAVDKLLEEHENIAKIDGEDVADTKLFNRVRQILGEDTSIEDYNYEKILDPKVIDERTKELEQAAK